mmetsp:Transcript_13964/g.39590  ORF Transcript_13964/g.39590 Transcript_13964/m.39590 type:complete len:148 (-) Transcript_13964:1073-1516(-)
MSLARGWSAWLAGAKEIKLYATSRPCSINSKTLCDPGAEQRGFRSSALAMRRSDGNVAEREQSFSSKSPLPRRSVPQHHGSDVRTTVGFTTTHKHTRESSATCFVAWCFNRRGSSRFGLRLISEPLAAFGDQSLTGHHTGTGVHIDE